MKTFGAIFLLLALPLACTQLPRLQSSPGSMGRGMPSDCERIYPQGDWQFVHAIEAAPPDGRRYTMLGVSRISSERRTIHCVLISLEGLVLFEAQVDQNIVIKRALPPFDTKGFAQGLIDDIALIFLAPQGDVQTFGYLADGAFVCRYSLTGGGAQDVVLRTGDHWEIRRYDADQRMQRTVKPLESSSTRDPGPTSAMVLKAYGVFGYELILRTVEALPLETGIP